ncbi:MAG: magnesium transporter [Armatimonadetes bacterium]|nr:magnesium transporter [Armatimonadota bacterium]
MRADEPTFIEQLKSLSRVEDPSIVREMLVGVQAEDLAEGLSRIELDEGLSILRKLDVEQASELLVEMPTETARKFVAELPDTTLAHYLDILPMDDALDLREELGDERFESLLEVIPTEDAEEIRRLMSYPEDSVGQLMTERFFEVMPDMTVKELLADIRRASDEKYETVNDLYVLDLNRHVLGVFSLRKAIRAASDVTARELMRTDLVTCKATDSAEEAARLMSRYGFYALPVLDWAGRMVGLFTGDDAQEVLQESETEDVLAMGAVIGPAEPYLSLGLGQLVRRRLPWLMILFVAEFLTAMVLRHYTGVAEEGGKTTLAQLMVFIPLLIGAGGNSGSQVTTTITRALAIGEIKAADAWVVLQREFVLSLCIGSALGVVGFGRALLWGSGMPISLTVAIALPAIIMWAACVGSLLPIAAKRVGIDPAVMSAPFIATLVDATGLVIFFETALRLLPKGF